MHILFCLCPPTLNLIDKFDCVEHVVFVLTEIRPQNNLRKNIKAALAHRYMQIE